MKSFTAMIALIAASLLVASEAGASRRPTTIEKREVSREMLVEVERDSPTVPTRVIAVRVSTIRISATSPYSKFAVVALSGYNERGEPIGDSMHGVLGYSKRYRAWTIIGYGSSEVACDRADLPLFGGQRAAILRDLGLRACSG